MDEIYTASSPGATVLKALRIRQLAIVEEAEVVLDRGLNAVTGETGAGKSILVGALELVLGARASAAVVRAGADAAEVEALFDVSDDPAARARLEAEEIEVEDEVVLRRVVRAGGGSRAYVNGTLATAAQLKRLAAGLVDISSQHAHHSLSDPCTHLDVLDAWARLEDPRAELEHTWNSLRRAQARLDQLRASLRERADREDLLRYQVAEIDKVDPRPGEDQKLVGEQRRLRHAAELAEGALGAEAVLYEAEGSICDSLGQLVDVLERLAQVDPILAGHVRTLDSARLELEDAARDLGRYGHDLEAEPERLAQVEERLAAITRLVRRYGPTLEDVLSHRLAAEADLATLGEAEGHLEEALEQREAALARATDQAAALSERRRAEAAALGEAISRELADLGMGGAEVRVEVRPDELSARGIDRAELLIAANPGEPPLPLAEVASGGELSRALLAIKRVLSGLGPVGTYVFDEVDTGVGGAVAEAIGRKLAEVGAHHQVIAITHLPQIAAYGDVHVHVTKGTDEDGRTRSRVAHLDSSDREEELARMLGGIQLTAATRAAARDLLRGAEAHRE